MQTMPYDRQKNYFYDTKGLGEILDGRGKVHVTYFYLCESIHTIK